MTLQRNEIIGCEKVNNIIPGISMLKSLEEFSCCRRIEPVVDIRISLDEEAMVWDGYNGGVDDDDAEEEDAIWDMMPNLNIDIWQQIANGDISVHFPIRLSQDSISFLLWFFKKNQKVM